ncbi:pyruvate formate-lyase-activating protein [Alkalinema sp. FACHB-956]|uniref:pyruvate formate-lyase-activating protein n=1 Tax=Alkalinema sp. FACHB-956 TaxID=2692768 RepID=UPI0016893577|nr:pyruvate formate-lyase-activating protein [Alkalinema sp. FACHB-956]MBD2327978.1 pyruvate formate lyase-activating protein [Alkalinema sp. FACHB-956]
MAYTPARSPLHTSETGHTHSTGHIHPTGYTDTTGYVHSFESCGTVDGPGIRFIVFTAGCPLRCLYCANPDCRNFENGKLQTIETIMQQVRKYKSYMTASGGGITVSGGEPLMQPDFVRSLLHQCQAEGIHTALDTSGFCDLDVAKPVLEYVNLVLLDIKSYDPEIYHKVTHVDLQPTLTLAKYLSDIGKPVWIRFVLVPGLTDAPHNIAGLADFLSSLQNIERVEVLPFHQLGQYKWAELGYDYQLKETQPPTPEQVEAAIAIFRSRGLTVF